MTATCVRCGSELDGTAYACPSCGTRKAGGWLREIIELTPVARDIANGQAVTGAGGSSGKPGSRLPIGLRAAARLDAISNELVTWARHIAAERDRPVVDRDPDLIVRAARYLLEQLEWMRHRAEVGEFLTDVEACARVVRGLARGRSEQRFLGPCGADVVRASIVGDQWESEIVACEGDVYAFVHSDGTTARTGRCHTCGAEVETSERQAWLDGEVRMRAFRASEIANAYGIHVKTIRSWAARGHLLEHGRDRDDRPLYNVGDVLDLAVADAHRREADRVKRERRAARAEETSDAA